MGKYKLEDRVLGSIVRNKGINNGSKTFLLFKDKEISYGDTEKITNQIANGLLSFGVSRGDKVCIMLKNSPEYIFICFALAKIGAIEVPINNAYVGNWLKHVLNFSDAKIAVIDEDFIDRINLIQEDLLLLEKVIIYSYGSIYGKQSDVTKLKQFRYEELLHSSSDYPKSNVSYFDPIAIIFTPGTTGLSKGAVLTHTHAYLWAYMHVKYMGLRSDDVLYTCLPFFHVLSQFLAVYGGLLVNGTVAIGEKFSASSFWEEVKKYNATYTSMVGAMAHILYNQPIREDDSNNPLRIVYALPAPKGIQEKFENRFSLKFIEAYGSSECNAVTFQPLDALRIGSCGKATDEYEVRIVDDYDNELPINMVGEFVVRGKEPFSITLGYYKMPEETLKVFRNFWFHTGDYGYMDEDGYYYFVDRKKDSIRRRGENISSYEIEKVISSHPKVEESAAVAVPSELGEDEVKICVVLKKGEKVTPDELILFCEGKMPYFAIPRYVEFLKNLPKTPTEKILKRELREARIRATTWDREKSGYKLKR